MGGVDGLHPMLQAITDTALEATGACSAWLLAVREDELQVVASSGPDAGLVLGCSLDPGESAAAYVAASGQPLTLRPRPGEDAPWTREHPLVQRVPANLLSLPCETEGVVVGVLELLDRVDGEPFTFDDVEFASLLATVAGATLGPGAAGTGEVPDPAVLGRELARLARDDPGHYARVAFAVEALLAHG